MTREKAIEVLKLNRDIASYNPNTAANIPLNQECAELAEACDIAIKALDKKHKRVPIVVAFHNSNEGGILSANTFEDYKEMMAWQMEELLRLCDDNEDKPVTIRMWHDSYGEMVMGAKCGDNYELDYKLFWQEVEA